MDYVDLLVAFVAIGCIVGVVIEVLFDKEIDL
jgi:hypothetical protein